MSSKEQQRGVFPGLEFFTTLGEIAKTATQKLKDIDRELNQSTSTQDLEDGTLWTELHLNFNNAYNQSIGLKQSLMNQQSISDSLESFNSVINWIKLETNRIEKQLQQFGYQISDNHQYQYQLPLTPQQQIIYDQQKKGPMETDHDDNNNNDDDDDINDDINDDNNNKMENQDQNKDKDEDENKDEDEDEDEDMDDNNDDDNNNKNNGNDIDINIKNKNKNKELSEKIVPTSPALPVLDDKFKFFFKNVCDRNNNNNKIEREKKESMDISSAPSTISTITPSFNNNYQSDLPETPILNKNFDINTLRMKCGINNDNINENKKILKNRNNSSLNDSLGSIPRLKSPKISLKDKNKENENLTLSNGKGLIPITPYQIKTTPQHLSNKYMNNNNKTPITVSSFSVRNKTIDNNDIDDKSNNDTNINNNNKKYGMSYIQQTEFDGIPSWITSKLGTIDEINKVIDIINNALKSMNGRMSKSEFGELIGKNETSFILLLTRTDRLKTDWFQGNSVYCLK